MELPVWHESVQKLEAGELARAIEIILSLPDPSARVLFNLSRCYEALQEPDNALQTLNKMLVKDPHSAVYYFQKGVVLYKLKRYEEAVHCFEDALKRVRQRGHIDYAQLGMRYKLYTCEILYNIALCQASLGHTSKARALLAEASKVKVEARHKAVDSGLSHSQRHELPLIELPLDTVFRPHNYKPGREKKDYLGKAKVLSAVDTSDQTTGFTGPQQTQREEQEKQAKLLTEDKTQGSASIITGKGSVPRITGSTSHGPPPDRPVPRLPPSIAKKATKVKLATVVPQSLERRKEVAVAVMSDSPPERPPRKGVAGLSDTMSQMNVDTSAAPPLPERKRSSMPATNAPQIKVEFNCNDKQTVLLQKGASLRELKSTASQVFAMRPQDFDLWTEEPSKKIATEQDSKDLWSKFTGDKLVLFCYGKK